LLAIERNRFNHGLLMLDYEGSGANTTCARELETQLDERLRRTWGDSAKAIVLTPEVDVWMWGTENSLRELFGWNGPVGIRDWLIQENFILDTHGKPTRPKEALEAICRRQNVPRSASLYEQIAHKISMARCRDAAFQRLRMQLQTWFPISIPR